METGNRHNPRLLHGEEQPVREPTYSGPPPSFFHGGIFQGSRGNSLNGIHHGLREALPEFRANVSGYRQPDNGQSRRLPDRPP